MPKAPLKYLRGVFFTPKQSITKRRNKPYDHADLMTTLRYIYTTETLDSMREYSEESSALKALDKVKQKPEAKIVKVSEGAV